MPRLRSRSGPLIKCAYEPCQQSFRKWRRRLYCSDACKKNAWRARHLPYYAQLTRERAERIKRENRITRKWKWVEEGKPEDVPEWITLTEALAQARPETIAMVKELIDGPPV